MTPGRLHEQESWQGMLPEVSDALGGGPGVAAATRLRPGPGCYETEREPRSAQNRGYLILQRVLPRPIGTAPGHGEDPHGSTGLPIAG